MSKYHLPNDVVEEIQELYTARWANAMLAPENILAFNEFRERNPDHKFSYQEVFFNKNGFLLYENNGEKRYFSRPTSVFPEIQPASQNTAEGDWKEWLRGAKLLEEIV